MRRTLARSCLPRGEDALLADGYAEEAPKAAAMAGEPVASSPKVSSTMRSAGGDGMHC